MRTRAGAPVWRPTPSNAIGSRNVVWYCKLLAGVTLFKGVDPSEQLRQPPEVRLEPHVVAVVLRRLPRDEGAVRNVAPHVRRAADGHVVADRRVAGKERRPGDPPVIADRRRPRHAGERG